MRTTRVSNLAPFHNNTIAFEMGVDESGRGPLFGRIYAAAVVLPKDGDIFDHTRMRDSKKVSSRAKMETLAQYIRENCVAYAISFAEPEYIDSTNILEANMKVMHDCMRAILASPAISGDGAALIDGNYFKPLVLENGEIYPFTTVVGGDGVYSSIAAASILARDARDVYTADLVATYPELNTRYSISTNQGYGTKAHMAGIATHGISQFHRKTFRPCSTAESNDVIPVAKIHNT